MRCSNKNLGLKPSEYRAFVKEFDRDYLRDAFRESPFDKDRNSYRLFVPIKHVEFDHTLSSRVINELYNKGFEVADYTAGLAQQGNRFVKIGKLLSKPLQVQYAADRQFVSLRNVSFQVVISRHPYDIARMSERRNWTSCLSLATELGKHKVLSEIKAGSLVAYLTSTSDNNINNPFARVQIRPYVNWYNQVAYGCAGTHYGLIPDQLATKFISTVNHVVHWLNTHFGRAGRFAIKSSVYHEGPMCIDLEYESLIARLTPNSFRQLPLVNQIDLIIYKPFIIKQFDFSDVKTLALCIKNSPKVAHFVNSQLLAAIETDNPNCTTKRNTK